MKVRRQRLRIHDNRRIAVAFAQITQNLVVRAVLFYDVDDVLNLSMKETHHVLIGGILFRIVMIILGHLCRQFVQVFPMRHGHSQKSGLGKLPYVLIRRTAG